MSCSGIACVIISTKNILLFMVVRAQLEWVHNIRSMSSMSSGHYMKCGLFINWVGFPLIWVAFLPSSWV